MLSVVHTLTQHVNTNARYTEKSLRDAVCSLGIESAKLTDKFVQNLTQDPSQNHSPQGGATVDYNDLLNTICEFCCSTALVDDPLAKTLSNPQAAPQIERWKSTVRCCFLLFDPLEGFTGQIPVRDLKKARGRRYDAAAISASSYTFPMHKALLDLCARPEITQAVSLQVLESEWLLNPALVLGFIEEVLRLILTERYGVRRNALYR
ncbi:hypothetical protein DIPPA_13020 [Diplonema papillatum]|nr:hypothetical protein DIPPA_13020 [Diplonema papillatum]